PCHRRGRPDRGRRAGGVAGLQAAGLASQAGDLGRAVALLALPAALGALLYAWLPETRGRPLPD
ncbi:MAG: hypothetical protein ACREPI_01075, partial [Candidatus Dormibacterales bacterium]